MRFTNGNAVGDRIREIVGEFNKCNLKPEHYTTEQALKAIERARELESNPEEPTGYWPEMTGTRIYLLAEELLKAHLLKLPAR